MNKTLSLKLTVFSFALMLIVILSHAKNIDYNPTGNNSVWAIQHFVLNYLTNVIVPTFFFISGFLFFMNLKPTDKLSLAPYKEKWVKRGSTVLIPYLLWTSFAFFLVYFIQLLPAFAAFFPTPFASMSVKKQLWNLYWEPYNYPLWYIRDLITFLLITPLVFLFLKYLKFYAVVILFVISVPFFGLAEIFDVTFFKFFMLMWFVFGAYCALYKVNLQTNLNTIQQFGLLILWFLLMVSLMYTDMYYELAPWQTRLFFNISTITGCLSLWTLYDYCNARREFKMKDVYNYSFFMYVAHGIPLLLLKNFYVKKFHPSAAEAMIFYVFSFVFMTLGCIFFAMFLKRILPKFYNLLTGNRD